MNSLQQLIRLHRWQLDEKRQKLAGLEALRAQMEQAVANLDGEVEREGKAADLSLEGAIVYPAFVAAALERRKTLCNSIAEIVVAIETAREEMAEAFNEVKRYEQAYASQQRRDTLRRSREEQALHDEQGLQQHRRRALSH